jgi:hypothetical protein
MALVSMKTTANDATGDTPVENKNPYSYGLEITLGEDQCDALGITTPPAPGTKVMIRAAAVITEIRQTAEADGDDSGPDTIIRLQITDMELGNGETSTAASQAAALYGGNND